MSALITHDETETLALGRDLSRRLKRGDVVAVYGDLGSGKTRFIKGICEGLGVRGHVISPTFTIVTEYGFPGGTVYHFDFYRVDSIEEIRDVGFEEYVNGDGICLIEWADRAKDLLPPRRFDIHMSLGARDDERVIEIDEVAEVLS